MGDIYFSPVFKEINSIIKGSKYLTMYFGEHFGKNLLILKHQLSTVMLVINGDNDSFNVEFIKVVSSREVDIKSGVKIVGNNNVILLLDGDGKLWRLINAFEFSNEKDECFYLLDENCFYEWVPFRQFKFQNVYEVTAYKDGFAFLGLSKNLKKLYVLSSVTSYTWEDFTFEALNENESHAYHLTNLMLNDKETNLRNEIDGGMSESLLITDKLNGRTYICMKDSEGSIINVSSLQLISLLVLESKKCLLLCFQNGKLVFIPYDTSLESIVDCTLFLSKKLVCIEKCGSEDSSLIWSDGINLHHTMMKFEFDKPYFVSLIHLQVNNNINGVVSLLKIHNTVLAVTINNFYYHIKMNNFVEPKVIEKSSEKLLSDIYEAGLQIDELNKEIEIASDFVESKEIIQNNDLSKEVELDWEGNCITIKSNIKKCLKKDFWRIKLLNKCESRGSVEMINLETDFNEGMTIKFETELLKKGQVEVSLVGDFGSEFDLLFAKLGKVGKEKHDSEEQELVKNLYDICKKRNPYFNKD